MLTILVAIICTILFIYQCKRELEGKLDDGTGWDVVLRNFFHYYWATVVAMFVEYFIVMICAILLVSGSSDTFNDLMWQLKYMF